MTFPLYRKYPNGSAFFEILSAERFRELKIIGGHYEIHEITARILPEHTYIADLINNPSGHYVDSDAAEFNRELAECQKQRKRLM